MIESNTSFSEADDVPAKPFCFARADLMEDVGVYHRSFGEEAFG